MTKLEKFTIINSLIFIIATVLWNISYSPVYMVLIIIVYISLIVSIIFLIGNLISLIKRKWTAIIFIIVCIIPILDTLTEFHETAIDAFKSKKILVATKNWGNRTNSITLRQDDSFEFRDQSAFGAKIYKGHYITKQDTFILTFRDNKPKFINDGEIFSYVNDNKLIIRQGSETREFPLLYLDE